MLGGTEIWYGFVPTTQRRSSRTVPTKGIKVKIKGGHKSDCSPFDSYLAGDSYKLPLGLVHLSK